MHKPIYIYRSRHNIYYFRWPIPAYLHPEGKTGHVKHSAFKHPRFFRSVENQKWKSELSGRLLSLTGNIVVEGEAYVEAIKQNQQQDHIKKKIKLIGKVAARVQNIRDQKDYPADVIYNPTEDNAHSNIVFFNQVPEECAELTFFDNMISKILVYVPRSRM